MCGDCFVCIYLVCQCDGLELGRRNRRITVRGVAVRINNNNNNVVGTRTTMILRLQPQHIKHMKNNNNDIKQPLTERRER